MAKAATNTGFDAAEIQTPCDSENDLCCWSFKDAQLFPTTWHAGISELEVSGSCDQNWTWCQQRQASKRKMENQIHAGERCQRVSIAASIKKMAQEDRNGGNESNLL